MPNVTIRDLPPVVIPIDVADTFLEVSVLEAGVEVSRRVAADSLQTAIGLDASFVTVGLNAALPNERVLTAGTDIAIVDGGAGGAITISVVGLVTTLAALNDVDLSGQAIGDLLFNVDGTNWEDTGGDLRIDVGLFEFQSNYTIVASGGIALRNANGDVFLDNVFLGGGLFQYSIAVGGNDAVTLRDNGLAQFGMSGGTETTTLISGVEVRLVRNGLDEIALSLAPAAGGLSVNNTLTGAGLERVLTESDASVAAVFQYAWLFSTTTAQADPGVNTLRFNNAVPASVTFIYIDDTGPEGQDLGTLIISNLTDGYQLEVADPTDADTIQRFLVTGPPVDFTGFWRIPVINLSAQSGSAIPGDGADIEIVFDFHQFIGQGTLSGNSKDILFWDGNAWNNSGSTIRVNQNRPAIGGAIALSGSSSADHTTAMLNVQVGNSSSGLWFMAGPLSTDGGYCFGDFVGTEEINWGWDIGAVVTDLFGINENLYVTVTAGAGFRFAEKAADHGFAAGFGEVWVRNDVANTLMFTDDTGADFAIAGAAAGVTSFAGRTGVVVGVATDYAAVGIQVNDSVGLVLGSGNDVTIQFDGTGGSMGGPGGGATFNVSGFAQFRVAESLGINEAAAPDGDVATVGQVWVLNATPNRLQFTGDTGIDMDLTTSLYTVAGALTISVEAAGGLVNLRGADNLDTSQRILQFTHLDGSIRGSIGQTAAVNDMRITNSVTNGAFEVILGGTGMYRIEPDPNTAFDLTRHDFTDDNGNTTFTVGVVAVTDVQMGAQVADGDGTLHAVGMHAMPPITQNAAITFDAQDFGRMFIHDEATVRIWTVDQLTDAEIGSIIGIININGTGTITLDPGAGVSFEYWDGTGFVNSTANRTLGEGQFTIYKRTDIEYVVVGPNIT